MGTPDETVSLANSSTTIPNDSTAATFTALETGILVFVVRMQPRTDELANPALSAVNAELDDQDSQDVIDRI